TARVHLTTLMNADQIQAAIAAVPDLTNVSVTGGGADPFAIKFDTAKRMRTVLALDAQWVATAADPNLVHATLTSIERIGGGKGNDILIGDAQDNRYVFEDGWGVDIVIDPGGGSDMLDFSGVSGPVDVISEDGVTIVKR